MLFGAWLGSEHFSSHDFGAMAVILLGVVIITLTSARARPMAPPSEPAA